MPGPARRRIALLVGAGILLVLLTAVIARVVQGSDAQADARVEDVPIGGKSRAEVTAEVTKLAAALEAAQVDIRTPATTLTSSAGTLGMSVDVPATVDDAMDAGRGGPPVVGWLMSLFRSPDVHATVVIDDATLAKAVAELDQRPEAKPTEPGFALRGGALVATEGQPGIGVAPADVKAELAKVGFARGLISIEVPSSPVPPVHTKADAEALIGTAEALIATPITVRAGTVSAELTGDQLRPWLVPESGPEGLRVGFDEDRANADLQRLLAAADTEPSDAAITLQGGSPVITGGTPGTSCCDRGAAAAVLTALRNGDRGPVELPVREVEPAVTRASIEALGITELVSSFTTRHKCCEPRVTNIHRIADMVRGTVIRPGETLSLNTLVGQRTVEKGFVGAPAIADGVLEEQIGGGVSQFATTIFNAAFFAGLDFGTYQSHSLYISRYPFGREATVSWPSPDLQIKNSSPHGILVWTSYDNTSITVSFYSTKWATVEQGAQTGALSGKSCTSVTTERKITYVDGTTKVDSVRARYRAGEGIDCGDPLPPGKKPVQVPNAPPVGGVTPPPPTTAKPPVTTAPPTSAPPTTAPPTTAPPTTAPPTTAPPSTDPPTTPPPSS